MGTRGIRLPCSLHLTCRVSSSSSVCGDIRTSARTSGRALTALGLYFGLCAWCRPFLHGVRLSENFQAKVSLQSDLATGGMPPPGPTSDLQQLRPSPTPAINSRRACNKVIASSSSGAVNLDTRRNFTVEYFASLRRPPRHLHRF